MFKVWLSPILHKFFRKNRKDGTLLNIMRPVLPYYKPQTQENYINFSYEYICKNPQQNTSKLNSATYKGLYTMIECDLPQECKVLTRKSINARYHFTTNKRAIIKKTDIKFCQGCEEIGTLITSGGIVKWHSYMGKLFDRCSKGWRQEHRVTLWLSNSISNYMPKIYEYLWPHKNLYMNDHRGIIIAPK